MRRMIVVNVTKDFQKNHTLTHVRNLMRCINIFPWTESNVKQFIAYLSSQREMLPEELQGLKNIRLATNDTFLAILNHVQ